MVPAVMAAMAIGKAGYGLYQANKQRKLADKLKQSNYVPPAVEEALTNSRMAANASVAPGYGRTLDKLRTSTANTINNAQRLGNPNTIQSTVSNADAREKEVLKDLEVNNAANQAQNRDRMNSFLQLKGNYQKQSWDAYNAAKSSLKGASQRNTWNALTGLTEDMTNVYGGPKQLPGEDTGNVQDVESTPVSPVVKNDADFTSQSEDLNSSVRSKYGYSATKDLLAKRRGSLAGFGSVASFKNLNPTY